MSIQQVLKAPKIKRQTKVVKLPDGAYTTLHVVRYERESFVPKVIVFKEATRLLDWCEANEAPEAIVGGFFLRASNKILGEVWTSGQRLESTPIAAPWHRVRAAIYVNEAGKAFLNTRNYLPTHPHGDLLQAGPLLVKRGFSQIIKGHESEGVSLSKRQFDTDITIGRYPRAAIGLNEKYIFSVVCDGRAPNEVGMTLEELAESMINLGATEALNLDGGGSATQISNGVIRNVSRGDGRIYKRGRPVYTALVFESR